MKPRGEWLRFFKTFAAALALYLFSLWLSLAIASSITGQPVPLLSSPNRVKILFLLPVLLLAALAVLPQKRHALLLQCAWGGIFLAAAANRLFNWLPFASYGDRGRFSQYILEDVVFPRWLGGSAIAGWLYHHLWQRPILASLLPARLADLDSFAILLGALVMCAGSILILHKWQGRPAVLLPLLTPAWLMFSAGYNEYYPYIAPLFLACLGWMFLDRLEDAPPWLAGILSALPAVFYIGFAPLSAFMLALYLVKRPRQAHWTLLAAALAYLACVLLFWRGSLPGFFQELHAALNLGERFTKYEPYQGLSASENSIFFRLDYALSPVHLREQAVMYFWGGGWAAPLSLLAGLVLLLVRSRGKLPALSDPVRLLWGAALLGWQWFYFIFMIPKLGPLLDVDLFFATYLATAFFAGLLLERLDAPWLRPLLAAIFLGCSAASTVHLLVWGISP